MKSPMFLLLGAVVILVSFPREGGAAGVPVCVSVAGVDGDRTSEEEVLNIPDPPSPDQAKDLDPVLEAAGDDGLAARRQFQLAVDDEKSVPVSPYMSYYPMCSSAYRLQSAAWYTVRYYVQGVGWRYRRAWLPVRIWHRVCDPYPQQCSGYSGGCCRQQYSYVAFPVYFRGPCKCLRGQICPCQCYSLRWVYIRLRSCCCCMHCYAKPSPGDRCNC